ncbi:hypothetical protein [Treponema endosymbiont of Eucomonympha sp.]|uniref:hypothetical protein n=1 Tax=Treponema endosymbiont of Eucomonympha sp. TaxID=1580831 RepID=UPI000783E02F|nr:hypothetical protein [Treponema endosymbiont of Eucomonympha sp.]
MNKTRNALLGIVSALALAAGAGFALYSCDGFADAAAQAAGDAADAGRMDTGEPLYEIRGPKGWVDYEFVSNDIGRLERDYVLGTDRTVRVKHYWRYTNDNLRKKLEAGGIRVTDYHSTSKAGEWCWLEFNLKEITEFKLV